ncbi:MAG TPA: hypothetical protein VN625_06465 [Desulfuromonadaceae bacterium]|nr:hypothetical protein [Desulfuromonadaceae bacterium]
MKWKWISTLTVAASLFLPIAGAAAGSDDTVDQNVRLQESFSQFKHLDSTNHVGEPEFQNLKLDKAININGVDYFGFRFTVPERTNHQDFAWAFILPPGPGFAGWYIVPQNGKMDGFENYFHFRRTIYSNAGELLPLSGKLMVLQRLPGTALEDGKEYLIWFGFKSPRRPASISLEFKFADLPDVNDFKALEKVLGLHRTGPDTGAKNDRNQ